MNKRRKLILDVVGIIFSIISIFIFTISFKVFSYNFRYLFILCDVFLFILFSNCIRDLDLNLNTNVYKYSKSNIESKYIKKVKVN